MKRVETVKSPRIIGLILAFSLATISANAMAAKEAVGGTTGEMKPVVAVSIQPQAYFVQRLAGDRLDLLTLVGPGQSPHSYEPTPRQMADLSRAKAWFTIAVEFENALLPKIASLYPGLRIVDTTKGIKFRSMEAHSHDDDDDDHDDDDDDHDDHDDQDEDHEARDPHVWLGRDSVKVQVGHILAGLSAIDPENVSVFRANYDAFIREIDALFDGLAKDLGPLRGKPVFVFHPAFGYFFDEFGIIQEAVETGGKEPTQRALASLIDEAKKEGAKTIFVQVQFPANAARSVASAIGGSVVEIDPLAADWANNLKIMAEALRRSAR
jgi:zinc transport system substrate-binding protein